MVGKNQDAVDELNSVVITNKKYLKYAKLDVNIIATSDMTKAIQFPKIFTTMALPTKADGEVILELIDNLTSKKTFIHVIKGIEKWTFQNVCQK